MRVTARVFAELISGSGDISKAVADESFYTGKRLSPFSTWQDYTYEASCRTT